MIGSVKNQVTKGRTGKKITTKNIESKNVNKIELIDKELQKAKLTKPVVIPSAINMQNVKKAYTTKQDTTQEVLNSTNSTCLLYTSRRTTNINNRRWNYKNGI